MPDIGALPIEAKPPRAARAVINAALAKRGMDPVAIDTFLGANLQGFLEDGIRLRDMEPVVEALAVALRDDARIVFFSDYDVDGATSASIMMRAGRILRDAMAHPLGPRPQGYTPDHLGFRIPERLVDGYGPNPKAMVALAAENVDLVVCLDGGTLSFAALEAARDAGLRVAVIDHHGSEPVMPPAIGVVNPNRQDEDPALRARFGICCTAGLALLVMALVARRLTALGVEWAGGKAPSLAGLVQISGLGTVADVVPLTGYNRFIVRRAVDMLRKGLSDVYPGMKALLDVSKPRSLAADVFGFQMGPRINAAGRLDRADPSVIMLTTDDAPEAARIAALLDDLNTQRREVQDGIQNQAAAMVPSPPPDVVIVAGEGWHEGVIGIVASRLKETYGRPALVFAIDPETGIAKGSGRSVPGFDLGAAIRKAASDGLLMKGGGHPMAAGMTIHRDRLEEFARYLDAASKGARAVSPDPDIEVVIDGQRVIDLGTGRTIDVDVLTEMDAILEPFGQGNPRPLWGIDGIVDRVETMSEGRHLRFTVSMPPGVLPDNTAYLGGALKCVFFGAGRTPMEDVLRAGGLLRLTGSLSVNEWRDRRTLQFMVSLAAPA